MERFAAVHYVRLTNWENIYCTTVSVCDILEARLLKETWTMVNGHTKGVGRRPTLAWPGWKPPDISVKVDTARLEAGQFKKCSMACVLLYYPRTEFQSTFNVY